MLGGSDRMQYQAAGVCKPRLQRIDAEHEGEHGTP